MRALQLLFFTAACSILCCEIAFADCHFLPPQRYPSAATKTVIVRDLDGDHSPDIIASGDQVDEFAAFSLLRNAGDGRFEAERFVASGFGEKLDAIDDLDQDGIPDLLASNYWSNGISIYPGRGALQFAGGTFYGTATHGGPSLLVDYDGDGKLDVISFSFGSGNPVRVHLFRGNGDGTLAPKTTIDTVLANAVSPSLRRVNGALEILAGERSGRLEIFHDVAGALSVSFRSTAPGFDLASVFGDVNGDGIADIIDSDQSDPSSGPNEAIFITLANADGTFGARKRLAQPRHVAFPFEIRVGDLDRDGKADLLVGDFRAASVFLFRGDGAGNFAEAVPIDAGGPVNAFDIGDVNADGRPDIVTANADHTVSVILNSGACSPGRRRTIRH